MLKFCIVDLGDLNFRCVLNNENYFDFTIYQTELFGYTNFFKILTSCVGHPIRSVFTDSVIGDVAGVRYNKNTDSIWILARNGVNGHFYVKGLGG